jgi:hypothetical protein
LQTALSSVGMPLTIHHEGIPMDSKTIKRKHAQAINKALFPGLNYLRRLQVRMEKVGFPPADPLYKLVASAYDAVLRLHAA